jgi:hypothetical protein
VRDGVAYAAGHLRGAAQRVGVLHAGVALGVRGDDGRALEHGQHARRAGLARVRAQRRAARGEHAVGAEQRLDAHRRGDVGDVAQLLEVVDGHHEHAEHAVGAVDEREPLLLSSTTGSMPAAASTGPASTAEPSGPSHLALAHEHERAVRERRQVAAAAQRPELAHVPA